MANTVEWDNFALSRKSLRVTKPEGQQRSSYFLQLPFRYAIPLAAASGLIHWIISQSLFLVRIDIFIDDKLDLDGSRSACGFSRLSLLVACMLFIFIFCLVHILSLRKWRINIPLAASCSLVISSACHPGSDENDLHLGPVQWGVIAEKASDPVPHCSFSRHDVSKPVEGKKYA